MTLGKLAVFLRPISSVSFYGLARTQALREQGLELFLGSSLLIFPDQLTYVLAWRAVPPTLTRDST